MVDNFFNEILQSAGNRIAPARKSTKFLLDKNEQSNDVDQALKLKVIDSLLKANWNRYPASDYQDIETKIAEYCNLEPENIVLSAGSASIITTLLDFFALNHKKITIAQPSYSLFDYHCKTYNIQYTPWYLTEDLEFDYNNLPKLDKDSVLILTSPNNPTGNTIDLVQLKFILDRYQDSLIILDGVYSEFSSTDFTSLINKYQNFMVLRSFSKAFPIAGLRLGYLCASAKTASLIKKLILQFSITHFSLVFARELLFNKEFMENSRKRVQDIIHERDNLSQKLKHIYSKNILHVFPSEGNFLLIRVFNDNSFKNLLEDFAGRGIKVLNTSSFTLLHNTFRVSIGNADENAIFLDCLNQSLADQFYTNLSINKAVA